ncbi:MAG: type IV pilin protein, partial [Gammaproteobacteria bacterium]
MNAFPRPLRAAGSDGFTLIELMIVVAVVGILATVAYPSYTAQVMRSHRASAQGLMTDMATRQHQFFV